MKIHNLIYILSITVLAIAIVLIVGYPNSGRIQLIAGVLTAAGFAMNIVAFSKKKNQ